jgi:methylglutaconyl-CoA hydratase
METPTYPYVQVSVTGSVATITLDRPEVHNAFDATMIASLTAAFRDVGARDDLRAVVLCGAGASFCAGADLSWMRASLAWSRDENIADATKLADLFDAVNSCPLPVIARVQGAALGGGAGLVACCDLVIAVEGTRFGFTEVKLGLAPATIAPYIVAKIGASQARALFITGERFDAARARTIGLVHTVVSAEQVDEAVDAALRHLRANGPGAMRAAKDLARRIDGMPPDEARRFTIALIAYLRVGDEAQEGVHAFLAKRRAAWVEEA